MTIDIITFLMATTMMIMYLVVHVIVFRRIQPQYVIKWLIYSYAIAAVLSVVLFFSTSSYWCGINSYACGWIAISSMVLIALGTYTFAAILYVLGFFGAIESSIRLRLLWDIYKHPTGITHKALFSQYNEEWMLKKRIVRMKSSDEIMEKQGRLFWKKKFSYFIFNDTLLRVFSNIYNV